MYQMVPHLGTWVDVFWGAGARPFVMNFRADVEAWRLPVLWYAADASEVSYLANHPNVLKHLAPLQKRDAEEFLRRMQGVNFARQKEMLHEAGYGQVV